MVDTRKNILFIVLASPESGQGHLCRTLELAKYLYQQNINIFYLIESPSTTDLIKPIFDSKPNYSLRVREQGELLTGLDEWRKQLGIRFDWIVIDNPNLSKKDELQITSFCQTLILYNDDMHQVHHCDVLINPNFGVTASDYDTHVYSDTKLLLGVDYIVLREEYYRESPVPFILDDGPLRLHVYFGNSLYAGECLHYVEWMLSHFPSINIDLVLATEMSSAVILERLKSQFPSRLNHYSKVDNMARLISSSHLAFGTPGITTWERAYLGVPSCYITEEEFVRKFTLFLNNEQALMKMSKLSCKLVDGLGASRIYSKLVEFSG